jgi:hypothetical protein
MMVCKCCSELVVDDGGKWRVECWKRTVEIYVFGRRSLWVEATYSHLFETLPPPEKAMVAMTVLITRLIQTAPVMIELNPWNRNREDRVYCMAPPSDFPRPPNSIQPLIFQKYPNFKPSYKLSADG